jgi:hypothetical protein
MSEATYTFTSVVRRGFTSQADGTATITVKVAGRPDLQREVTTMSPADVVGIAPGQVIRTWPLHGVTNAEPNYLALVELDAPELPWLFSRPDAGGRVHPWLTLVVLDETELEADPLTHGNAGTTVKVPSAQRPDPGQAWMWTHGQLLGTDTIPDDPTRSLARLVCPRRLQEDRRYVACVVPTFDSGRRAGLGETLAPGDPARASATPGWTPPGEVVLPVYYWWRFGTGAHGDFESLATRLRGVPLPPGTGRRRLRLDHPLSTLPSSGTTDLELHVALRPPGEATGPSGVRPDYVAALRERLADAGYDVSLLGSTPPRVGPPVHGQLPVGADARASALGSGALPPWLDELNLDPRHRVAAGIGAEVVRRNQEHYMEQAWRQVGDVLAANRLRRRAEFSLGTSTRLYRRWISRLDAGDLVTTTSPVHPKVGLAPGQTMVGRLRDSPVPPAVVSVELRRLTRSRGPLSHGTQWQQHSGVQALAAVSGRADALVHSVPLDAIDVLDPPSTVWGLERTPEILETLVPGLGTLAPAEAAARLDAVSRPTAFTMPRKEELRERVGRHDLDRTLSVLGLVPVATLRETVPPEPVRPPAPPGPVRPGPFGRGPSRPGPLDPGGVGFRPLDLIRPERDRVLQPARGVVERSAHTWTRLLPTEVVDVVRTQPELVRRVGEDVVLDVPRLELLARTGSAAVTLDRSVFERLVDGTYERPAPTATDFGVPDARAPSVISSVQDVVGTLADLQLRPGDSITATGTVLEGGLEALKPALLAALDPRTTLTRAVNSRIAALRGDEAEVFDDIMAAPDLSEPTYARLSAISHDWLLPGLDSLPADTTTLAAANLDFIASFLVGMNHELAAELLWREYPTDQRGTYARQFWTHVHASTPEGRYDLKQELHRARRASLRGLTRTAGAPDSGDPLVLVIKGELVQRYPGLILVAAQTALRDGTRVPAGTPMEPDFLGRLEPDVLLAGFTGLTAEEVWRREREGNQDRRWWFFLAEHFGEPRFGLDATASASAPPATWNDASWEHLPDTGLFLTPTSFTGAKTKGDGRPTGFAWGSTAATQAWITVQFPFRLGIPASRLLPPEEP